MKNYKYLIIGVISVFLYTLIKCNQEPKPELTPTELKEQQIKDSIVNAKKEREKKIDVALTTLKMITKEQMNDPSSFKMLDRTYDAKDSVNDVVKLLIKFTGTNKFGGVVTNVALGEVDLKTEIVTLKEIK